MLTAFPNPAIDDPTNVAAIVPRGVALPARVLRPGEVLYEVRREAGFLYLVDAGVLKAMLPTSMGRDRIVDLYGPGDVLGVAALCDGSHFETAIALHEANVIPIHPQLALNDRKLVRYLSENLACQLRRSREAVDDAGLPVGARLSRLLLRLSKRFGRPADHQEGVKLPLALTHGDLASFSGTSRVTVTRILGELREEGAVVGSRGVYIVQPERLEAAIDHYVMQVL
jgi:CRP-like cAMP-binding protein